MTRILLQYFLAVSILFTTCDLASQANAQSSPLNSRIEESSGSTFNATLIAFDADQLTVQTDSQLTTLPYSEIARIILQGEPTTFAGMLRVNLIDQSELACSSVTMNDGSVMITTDCGVEATIKSRFVDSVRLFPISAAMESEWKSAVEQPRESDAILFAKEGSFQMIDGVLENVKPETVAFTIGDRTAEIKRAKLSTLLFYRRLRREFESPVASVSLVDGSSINVQSIQLIQDGVSDEFELTTVSGSRIRVPAIKVVEFDFGGNRFVWLSDLDPVSNDWSPIIASPSIANSLARFSTARIDRSFGDRPLVLAVNAKDGSGSTENQTFERGFAIKGGGKLSFSLAGQYKKLTGKIGFDPNANPSGNVRLIVQLDGRIAVDEVLDAEKMTGPFQLDLDLESVQRLVFRIDYNDRRSIGDVLHAVDVKLTR